MGKNQSGTTDSTGAASTDGTAATDFTAQQQKQPQQPTGQLDAPPGDDALKDPVIINR